MGSQHRRNGKLQSANDVQSANKHLQSKISSRFEATRRTRQCGRMIESASNMSDGFAGKGFDPARSRLVIGAAVTAAPVRPFAP